MRNLATYTQSFDNAVWSKTGSSIVADSTTAPDGTTTADTLVEDTSNGAHGLFRSTLITQQDTVYTRSVYVKAAGELYLWMQQELFSGLFAVDVYFNIGDTGAPAVLSYNNIGSVNNVGIVTIGSDWYRCWMMFNSGHGTSAPTSRMRLARLSTGVGINGFVGDGTSGVYLWGKQLELGVLTAYQAVLGGSAPVNSMNPATDLYRVPCTGEVAFDDAAGLYGVNEIGGLRGSLRSQYARFATLAEAVAAADSLNFNAGPDRRYETTDVVTPNVAYRTAMTSELLETDTSATHAAIRIYGVNSNGREVVARFDSLAAAQAAVSLLNSTASANRRHKVVVL